MSRLLVSMSFLIRVFALLLRLHGVSLGSRSDMEELLAFVENHRLSPIIDARYSFDAPSDALDHL
jgi:D-arabinose 1-dehydrogenase-like Zn-dependent alcohol dehydrogenase